jgi:N-acetylmuramoyl-L-alanine amidase
MNKFITIVLLVLGLGLFLDVYGSGNQITKIFHHQGMVTDNIVCYLKNDPICNKLPNKPHDKTVKKMDSLIIFLPQTQLQNTEVKSMAQKVHNAKREGYTITFNEVITPIKGIKITIAYDDARIMCDYQTFNAITGDKGLVISFHNKDMLTKLKTSTDSLIQYALNKADKEVKPRIMLDLGHGGDDNGKIGHFNILEKNISFQVGTKVASLLKRSGCEVFLSRYGDYFVALDERTTMANKKKVDLFLSIHANSGSDSQASGIETYCLDSSLLKGGLFNKDAVFKSLVTHRDQINNALAQSIHVSALNAAKQVYEVKDRKVKKSVSQVLLGTDITIPTALIEIGFLSNKAETKLLMSPIYQVKLAQGIAQGILNYLKKTL